MKEIMEKYSAYQIHLTPHTFLSILLTYDFHRQG